MTVTEGKNSLLIRALCMLIGIGFAFSALAPVPFAFASADEGYQTPSGDAVLVTNENSIASAENCPFALTDFSRAQKGSNRAVDGTYQGYRYLTGAANDSLVVIATAHYNVLYVPASALDSYALDLNNTDTFREFQALLQALDASNSSGSHVISTDVPWYVVSEDSYTVEGVTYLFGQQLDNNYYACVIGADGSDVTSSSNPHYISLSHADTMRVVAAENSGAVANKTGLAAFADFLTSIDYSPLWVTLKTTGVAIVIIFILGLLCAWGTLHLSPRLQDVADAILTIPMVLPPTVCGFLLLLCLGSNTPLGQWFDSIGFPLVFSWPATVIAAVIVALPLMYRSARGAFENLDPNMLDAARTLGWGERKIFTNLMIPLAWPSIAAGTVLAFARALGEFGATLFLAGNYLGITRTIPIAIYFEWMSGRTDVALFWTFIVILISFVVILFINLWGRRTNRYRTKDAKKEQL